MNYGSEALKREIIPDVLAGKKFISLAISEAFAGEEALPEFRSRPPRSFSLLPGSDVAGLRCTAKKTPVRSS
jgi:hypothetical protein